MSSTIPYQVRVVACHCKKAGGTSKRNDGPDFHHHHRLVHYCVPFCYLLFLGCVLPFFSLILVVGCLALCLVRRKGGHKKKAGKQDHIVLKKDDKLKDRLVDVASDIAKLENEFKQLEKFVQEEIKEPLNNRNTAHNRYNDICK